MFLNNLVERIKTHHRTKVWEKILKRCDIDVTKFSYNTNTVTDMSTDELQKILEEVRREYEA